MGCRLVYERRGVWGAGGCMKGGGFGGGMGQVGACKEGGLECRWVHERRVVWSAGGCMKGGWFGVQVGA